MTEVRRGPLAWGQRLVWLFDRMASVAQSPLLVTFNELAVPGPIDVAGVLAAVDALVVRHEALRTTFTTDRHGTPVQVVHEFDGRHYEHRVVTAATGDRDEWLGRAFDVSVDWPVRLEILVAGDRPVAVRLAVHRLVLDHHASEGLLADLHELLEAGGQNRPADLPGDVWHPLDVAELEGSPVGIRDNQRALAYWERGLAVVPSCAFPNARAQVPGDGQFSVRLRSRSCRLAVTELAAALRVTEPAVLTAVSSLALVLTTGSPECAMSFVAPNRTRPGMRHSLGTMADRALLTDVLDPGLSFRELVRRIESATLRGYRHSHYDPGALHRLIAETALRRGILLHRLPRLNILPIGELAAEAHADEHETFDTDTAPAAFDGAHVVVEISARMLDVTLRAGDHILSAVDGEEFVHAWRRLLLAARDRPDAAGSDLAPVTRMAAPEGTLVDHCRVDPDAVAEVLRGLDGVDGAAVFAGEATGLHAFVATRRPELTPAVLRVAVFELLGSRPGLMCPHEFTVCRRGPRDPANWVAWGRVEAVHSGPGWPVEPVSPHSDEQKIIVEAFARVHPDAQPASVDIGLSYLGAGGRLERIPTFLEHLTDLGYRGIDADELLGWHCLQTLAGRLEAGT